MASVTWAKAWFTKSTVLSSLNMIQIRNKRPRPERPFAGVSRASLWAQNSKVSKRVLSGVCKTVPKLPEKVTKYPQMSNFGIFFFFSGILRDFFADPRKDSFSGNGGKNPEGKNFRKLLRRKQSSTKISNISRNTIKSSKSEIWEIFWNIFCEHFFLPRSFQKFLPFAGLTSGSFRFLRRFLGFRARRTRTLL